MKHFQCNCAQLFHAPLKSLALMATTASMMALTGCGAGPTDSTQMAKVARAEGADYGAIVADPSRSAADRADDAVRMPVAMLAFAQVHPGMAVLEMLPGGGYFTRLFAAATGDGGNVTLYVPDELMAKKWVPLQRAEELRVAMGNPTVLVAHYPLAGPVPDDMAERYDVVWTSRNYHDFHNIAGYDGKAYNAMVLDLLKPGGVYVVLDHAAPDGSGKAATDTTHRIDADLVRREVESAGFIYDGESPVLKNPADDRLSNVFDSAIKGRTDQFVLRFRKPG
ncbi:methyltransferase [Croceicoccus ponticola]|uniref:Methyltransferase n=1 Tax=Croceicoccus ponticola TaxID=2217664 RepID=A0A437H1T4_9SPHN|nr:class I SAM-dependent methyltransferase [Croceicoccus ponticola]RVQ69482.1 methyltransferase [Croceicoccus ponticola]